MRQQEAEGMGFWTFSQKKIEHFRNVPLSSWNLQPPAPMIIKKLLLHCCGWNENERD